MWKCSADGTAQQAMSEALVHNRSFAQPSVMTRKTLEELTKGNRSAARPVTVKKNAKSVKTMVKADETGTFVIVANREAPHCGMTKEGKLLFDDESKPRNSNKKFPPNSAKAQQMLEEDGTGYR